MKMRALLVGAALAAGLASTAFAGQLIITDVETGNGPLNNVSVQGWGTPWTTPILMTDSAGYLHIVFCDDLNHDVYVGAGQNLTYHTGKVTVDGAGNAISESVSNRMGQLASLGQSDYLQGDEQGAIAAQAAIWGLEYNIDVSSTDTVIESNILRDLRIADNGGGYAIGIISDIGTQNQLLGGVVPEPGTWAMMVLGVLAVGVSLRLHYQQDRRLEEIRRETV